MDKFQFLRELKTLVAWQDEPQLDDDDLELIFTKSRRIDVGGYRAERTQLWEANTHYEIGDVVVPRSFDVYDTERTDEHSYVVTTAGTSSSTEPTWAETVSDSTITWERHEAAYWTPTYDLNYAAYLAWGIKASKAAGKIAITSEGATFHREQYLANCQKMQRFYASKLNYSVRC